MRKRLITTWLPIVLAGTVILWAGYLVNQQTNRMAANDPQIAIVSDAAEALLHNITIKDFVGTHTIDMGRSLDVFVMVYDEKGALLASSGLLDGRVPVIPAGVLDYARTHDDNRVTWQPASGVRIAAVAKYYSTGQASSTAATVAKSGFVVAGRNIGEIENRQSQLLLITLVAWVAMLVLPFLVLGFDILIERNPPMKLE